MVIVPNSRIRLLKSPIELDNRNQLTFSNVTAQTSYFLSLPYLEYDNCTYQRKEGVIRYETEPNGITYEEIEANKAEYRAGLIELGNWGRSQSPNYWLEKIISQEGKLIVTDVRVPHEYEVFKSAGAISIRIESTREVRASRGTLVGEDDITEVGLDNITDWDYVIENNSDYDSFKSKLLAIIDKLK